MRKTISFLSECSTAQGLALLLCVLLVSPSAKGQDHVLSVQEIQTAAASVNAQRQADSADLDRFLGNDKVKQVMKDQKVDEAQVRKAIAILTDEDLSKLAAKARSIESDIIAGRAELTDAQVTLFIMGFFFIVFMAVLVIAFK